MSETYSRESGSLFPDSLFNMPEFKDIDDSVKDIMMQYYKFLQENNYNSANALMEAHAEELDSYNVTADKLNLILEELDNIGTYALLLRTNVISDTQPELEYDDGVYWTQPIGFQEIGGE